MHPDEGREEIARVIEQTRQEVRQPMSPEVTWSRESAISAEYLRSIIMAKGSVSASGMDEVRVSHVQSVLTTQVGDDRLPEAVAEQWETTFETLDLPPDKCWTLNAIEDKIGQFPLAAGSVEPFFLPGALSTITHSKTFFAR